MIEEWPNALTFPAFAAVAGRFRGLGGFDPFLEVDVGDSIVELDAQAAGFLFLRSGRGTPRCVSDVALAMRITWPHCEQTPCLPAYSSRTLNDPLHDGQKI